MVENRSRAGELTLEVFSDLPTPRHATPRHATPRHATPRHVTQARKHDDEKTQGGDENKPTPCHPKGFCD
jgi:hypothetical protein